MNLRLKRARELAGYAVQLTKDEGLPTMLKRGAGFVKRRCFGKKARYLPAKKVLEAQRAEMAGKTADTCGLPTISILTPLYNTPEKYLREFLDSFVNQTAPNGQLCLADASDAQHGDVQRIVEEYQAKNQRIVYKKIENKGIAANTNAAAQLATGEYLALADHDDILAPHALYTMGKAALQLRQRGEPDGFLYSDEALFSKSILPPTRSTGAERAGSATKVEKCWSSTIRRRSSPRSARSVARRAAWCGKRATPRRAWKSRAANSPISSSSTSCCRE